MADFLDPTYQCDIAPQARFVNRVVKRIGIALFSEFGLLDIAVVVEAFHAANVLCESLMGGRVQYEVSLLSAHGGRVSSSSSVLVRTESNCIDFQRGNFCALFIAGGTRANADLRDDFVRRGLVFNEVDQAAFRAKLPAVYATWKEKLGTKCWNLVEAEVGKLG